MVLLQGRAKGSRRRRGRGARRGRGQKGKPRRVLAWLLSSSSVAGASCRVNLANRSTYGLLLCWCDGGKEGGKYMS